jgi:hypothetical protein
MLVKKCVGRLRMEETRSLNAVLELLPSHQSKKLMSESKNGVPAAARTARYKVFLKRRSNGDVVPSRAELALHFDIKIIISLLRQPIPQHVH